MGRGLSKSTWVLCGLIAWGLFRSSFHAFALAEDQEEIWVLRIEGVINPLSARYLKREVENASQQKTHAIILELNTPGGLESSMREMVQSMLASIIPVIVYVTPQGSRAASAGMFITIAGHVAAMAPGTSIGAAHPVSIGGGQGQEKQDEALKEKVVSDAAALARSVAKAQEPGVGIFGAAGIIAFVLGSLMLYTPISPSSPASPRVQVSPWLIAGLAAIFSTFVAVVFKAALAAKRHPSVVGSAALVGSIGVAVTAFAPRGTVKIDSENWSAILAPIASGESVRPGDTVEIVGTEGVILLVRKHEESIEPRQKKQKIAR